MSQMPERERGWIVYEPGPQADSPLLGCAMLPILLIASIGILILLYSIAKEIL